MKITILVLALYWGRVLLTYQDDGQTTANVTKRSGLDVYVYSTPTKGYEVFKTGNILFASDCVGVINEAVEKAKAKKADAVIVYFETNTFDYVKYK